MTSDFPMLRWTHETIDELPDRFAPIWDAAWSRDQLYLRRHPDESSYVRPYVPGEFHPYRFDQGSMVRVDGFTMPDGSLLCRLRLIDGWAVLDMHTPEIVMVAPHFLPPDGVEIAWKSGLRGQYWVQVSGVAGETHPEDKFLSLNRSVVSSGGFCLDEPNDHPSTDTSPELLGLVVIRRIEALRDEPDMIVRHLGQDVEHDIRAAGIVAIRPKPNLGTDSARTRAPSKGRS